MLRESEETVPELFRTVLNSSGRQESHEKKGQSESSDTSQLVWVWTQGLPWRAQEHEAAPQSLHNISSLGWKGRQQKLSSQCKLSQAHKAF